MMTPWRREPRCPTGVSLHVPPAACCDGGVGQRTGSLIGAVGGLVHPHQRWSARTPCQLGDPAVGYRHFRGCAVVFGHPHPSLAVWAAADGYVLPDLLGVSHRGSDRHTCWRSGARAAAAPTGADTGLGGLRGWGALSSLRSCFRHAPVHRTWPSTDHGCRRRRCSGPRSRPARCRMGRCRRRRRTARVCRCCRSAARTARSHD